jgi:hypothetical protein
LNTPSAARLFRTKTSPPVDGTSALADPVVDGDARGARVISMPAPARTDVGVNAPFAPPAPTTPAVEPMAAPHADAPAQRSNAAVLTTELVGGLRTASRHMSRPSASEGHLRTELTITARRIDSVINANDAHGQAWAIAAMSLVHDAGAALDQRRITDGWQLLRAAQTELLDGLDRRGLAVERANITGSDLVIDDDVDTDVLRSEVWAMRHTKNTYRAELERRMFEAARGLFHRAWMIIGVLVLGAVGVLVAAPSSDSADALGSITAYLTIIGLGMTGAAVSHVLFTDSSKRASAVSEVVNPVHVVMLRLAFGGVAGLLVVVLLQADIQNLVNVTALSAYPWAILGGFAERYVDRVIDRVEVDAHAAAAEACRIGVS